MASPSGDEADPPECPRFEHGEDLLVVVGPGPTVKFQTTTLGEWIRADSVVNVEETC